MKYRIAALCYIILSLAVVGAVEAQDKPSLDVKIIEIDSRSGTEGEREKCEDNAYAMSACRSFIKGFIQGALLTDTAIIKSLEDSEPSFAERAMRTRLGTRGRSSPTALAGFCLPEDRTLLDLAEETLDHVKSAERYSVELASRVYESLKTDYPCT